MQKTKGGNSEAEFPPQMCRPGLLKMAEHSVLFFAAMMHHLEVTKDGTVDEGEAINFAISGVAPPPPPPVRPTMLWHLGNTALAWRSPKCMCAGCWSICCPCDCKVCPLCNSACLLTLPTNSQKFTRNSHEFRAYERLGQVSECRSLCGIRTKFVQI